MKKSWVQCPVTRKLIPKEEYQGPPKANYHAQGDIEPFISPIDQKPIYSRRQLRDHMKQHGVTDQRDYSEKFIQDRAQKRIAEMQGTTKKAKKERIEAIQRAMAIRGIE